MNNKQLAIIQSQPQPMPSSSYTVQEPSSEKNQLRYELGVAQAANRALSESCYRLDKKNTELEKRNAQINEDYYNSLKENLNSLNLLVELTEHMKKELKLSDDEINDLLNKFEAKINNRNNIDSEDEDTENERFDAIPLRIRISALITCTFAAYLAYISFSLDEALVSILLNTILSSIVFVSSTMILSGASQIYKNAGIIGGSIISAMPFAFCYSLGLYRQLYEMPEANENYLTALQIPKNHFDGAFSASIFLCCIMTFLIGVMNTLKQGHI